LAVLYDLLFNPIRKRLGIRIRTTRLKNNPRMCCFADAPRNVSIAVRQTERFVELTCSADANPAFYHWTDSSSTFTSTDARISLSRNCGQHYTTQSTLTCSVTGISGATVSSNVTVNNFTHSRCADFGGY